MSAHTPEREHIASRDCWCKPEELEPDMPEPAESESYTRVRVAQIDALRGALLAIADNTVRIDGRFARIAVDRFQTIARAALAKVSP